MQRTIVALIIISYVQKGSYAWRRRREIISGLKFGLALKMFWNVSRVMIR